MSARALTVWRDGSVVGALSTDRHGDIGFAYDPQWLSRAGATALSQSLPLRNEPFNRRECLPFFDGVLPEETQREAVAAVLGVSSRNPFRLLEELGGDVAGAISLWPEGAAPPPFDGPFEPRRLSEKELKATIDLLPARPLLAGESGLRLSLAGAQAKLPVVATSDGVALPAPGQPTTHILKPAMPRFAGSTENEAFAMRLAKEIGLDAAEVEIRHAQGQSFLLVARYDRRREGSRVMRLHQEDFCQALGKTSAHKYASDGGPVFRDLFALLRRVATRPALEVLKLFDAAIFNLIIGNADAHGKNYSLLYDGGVVLAPLYDLLSTVLYPELSPRLAMRVAGRRTLEEIERHHWRQFAEETGLTEPFIRKRTNELCGLVLSHAGEVPKGFTLDKSETKQMSVCADLVSSRAESLAEKA